MRLEDVPVPAEAEERSWQVVRSAFAARTPNPRPRRLRPSLPVSVAAAVAALALTAAALSASGSSVIARIRRAIGVQHAAAVLVRLPSSGRLLVNASSGPWIVSAEGTKRHLGGAAAAQASWSPHGLYEVVVLGRRQLAAIDPKGAVRWSLARGPIGDPRWSLDGYRIAYRSGSSLRVVAGDGTGDHLVAREVAPVAPAWDGSTHQLAYADRQGRIHLVNADSGETLWTSKPVPRPTVLAWEPGDRQLVVLGSRELSILDAATGALAERVPIGPGPHTLAVSPDGPLALTARSKAGESTILLFQPRDPRRTPHALFHGAGVFNGLAWSPNGRWLLASWATADQWVFINLDPRSQTATRVQAVSSIAGQFGSRQPPSLSGWCCAAGIPPP